MSDVPVPDPVEKSASPAIVPHTPAPWTVDANFGSCIVWAGNMRLCDLRGWGHLTGVGGLGLPADEAAKIQDANAHLIAAAPELLAAARAKLADCADCKDAALMGDECCSDECATLAAAIAKAEGRQV